VGTTCRVHSRASKSGDQRLRLLRTLFGSLEAVVREEMGEHDTLQGSERWHAGTPQDKVGASGPFVLASPTSRRFLDFLSCLLVIPMTFVS
jgi:hypothetical protein